MDGPNEQAKGLSPPTSGGPPKAPAELPGHPCCGRRSSLKGGTSGSECWTPFGHYVFVRGRTDDWNRPSGIVLHRPDLSLRDASLSSRVSGPATSRSAWGSTGRRISTLSGIGRAGRWPWTR